VPDSDVAPTRFVAPGDEILVPVPGGGFDYASGSSLSAAQVSGIIALLVAERPGLGSDAVNRLLIDSRAGGVSVNACRALAHLLHRSGCRDDATALNSTAGASERDGERPDEPGTGR
jgi:subtilisin family serine protease